MRTKFSALMILGLLSGCTVEKSHESGTITSDETWTKGVHTLKGSITIENAVLEVEACSEIRMPPGSDIDVREGAAIKLVGQADCPILITSDKAGPAAGDWGSISIRGNADNGSIFEYVTVEYGGGGGYGSIWLENGATFTMTSSIVRKSKAFALEVSNDVILKNFTGNTFVDNTVQPISIDAGDAWQLGEGTYGPNTVNNILVRGGTVEHTGTWLNHGVPYLSDGITVEGGVLTVEAGTVIQMKPNTGIDVRTSGGLTLAGIPTAPVTITSNKPTPGNGDWAEISFRADSSTGDNIIDNAIIEYGGGGGYGMIWLEGGTSVAIDDSILRNSGDYGIQVNADVTLRSFTGNTISGCTKAPIWTTANGVRQIGVGIYEPNTVGVIWVVGSTMNQTGTWLNHGIPYVVDGLTIEDAVLTVEEGNMIMMRPNTGIDVRTSGGLTLAGTSLLPITITSDKPTPAAGDWAEIALRGDSSDGSNIFRYTTIEYGGQGYGQLWLEYNAGVTLDNVTFTHTGDASCDVKGDLDSTLSNTGSTYQDCRS